MNKSPIIVVGYREGDAFKEDGDLTDKLRRMIKVSKVKTKCEYCGVPYKGIATHEARCKKRKKWQERLDNDGIIEEGDTAHFSGGMKIYLMLGRGNKTEEDKIFHKNLTDFEKKHNATVEYDSGKDEVYLRDN